MCNNKKKKGSGKMNKTKTIEPKKKVGGIEDLWREDIVEFDSEELSKLLEESQRQYKEGKTHTLEEVVEEMNRKYGLHLQI